MKGQCPRPLDDRDIYTIKQRTVQRVTVQNHLKNGGAKRDRTADFLHAMQALYQLSYGPDSAQMLGAITNAVNQKIKNYDSSAVFLGTSRLSFNFCHALVSFLLTPPSKLSAARKRA